MWLYLIIGFVNTLIVIHLKWRYSHWQRLGFPFVEAQIPFGVLDPVIYDVYTQSKDKAVEFASFHERGVYVDEEHNPMSGGLFFLKGKKWKDLRTKLTPSFTTGKLKGMFSTIEHVSFKMVDHIKSQLPKDGVYKTLEVKHIFVIYAIDIIASSIFGLDVNSFDNPENEFYALSKSINEKTYLSVFRAACQFLFPSLEKLFQRVGWTEAATECMKKLVRRTIKYREENNVMRKDILQLLLQLRNTGKINDDNDEEWSAQKNKSMSEETIAAQLFMFYVAGFETSATTAAFTLYELAQYNQLLQKAQNDVKQALELHGKLTYDALKDMKFLDLCVMETTRKYPGLPILNRECTQDYTIPETDLVIKRGTPIIISLLGMHRDSEYFPNSLIYDPERFLNENINYTTAAYMPFGEGPRHCIAQRMGKVIVKTAIAQILAHFNIEINESPQEIEIDNFGISLMPKRGIPIRLIVI